MRRSKSMLVVATFGLALGIALAIWGWEGLRGVLIFLEQQGPRLLGSILVVLSIAVLVRQTRSRSVARQPSERSHTPDAAPQGVAPQPPEGSQTPNAAPQGADAISHAESLPSHALLDFRRLLLLAVVVLMVFFAFAFELILNGTGEWVTLGLKIFELSTQMVLVAVLGGVLVQAYVKWHSRESSMNDFRKATAEAVIHEYFVAKKVRRLLRADCIQGPAEDKKDPWTDIPWRITRGTWTPSTTPSSRWKW
jgi:hypothetical protein